MDSKEAEGHLFYLADSLLGEVVWIMNQVDKETPIIFPATYRCNLACSYCRERLRTTLIDPMKSIKKIKELPGEWVYITGGEPLIIDDISDICDTLRAQGKKVGLTTNGTIEKSDIVQHIDRLGISIDGPKDINDRNRGTGSFNRAVEFLKRVSGRTEVGIMCTVGPWNKDYLGEVEALGEEIGCDFVQFTDVA